VTACFTSASVANRFTSQVFLKESNDTEVNGREIKTVTYQPYRRNESKFRLAVWSSVISFALDYLRSTCLASDLQQTPT
jgi:hypothetical protein